MKALYLEENKKISILNLVKKLSDTYQLQNTNLSYKINPEAVTYLNNEKLYGLIKPKPHSKTPIYFLYSNEPSPININLPIESGFKSDNDIVDENFIASKFDLVLQEGLNKNSKALKPNQDGVFKSLRVVLTIQWLVIGLMALPILFEYITAGNLNIQLW
tara:strand:+ start:7325 stop:7804 length:480 start_codon:yes stop_codon:yes gene_type:complete